MKRAQKVKLSLFREDPDNVSVATDEEIQRLAGKLKRVPLGLTAMRIAYVTDAPGGGRMVISGNKRLRCLKAAYGEDGEVPAEWFQDITAMSEAERHEFRINANISDGSFDAEKLLAQYDPGELAELMSAEAIDELCKQAEKDDPKSGQTDADSVPSAPETPVSKRGEVYICGEHRLMCGDSANAVDWGRLTAGEKADMVFTDPPYGVAVGDKNKMLNAIQPSNRVESNIANDAISIDDLKPILKAAFENLRENTADDACWFVTSPQGGDLCMMMMMMADAGVPVRHVLMWRKNTATFSMGRLDYDYAHEPIFYTWTKSHHNFRGGDNRTSVWEYDKPRKCDLHPTMKPVELVANAVMDGTEPGMTVADAFGGSGTTMIAAERTGRKAWLMELDPHYCDVIRKRWAEFVHGEGCDWQALTPKTK